MATKQKASATTADIMAAMRDKYQPPQWAALYEVADSTGFGTRRCDCMAMSLWPSKGLHLHGHEVKASRSDWLKELQDPSKAETFAKHCHYWWIVAARGIVKPEEMPARWGLMELTSHGNLRVKAAATIRDNCELNYAILAAMLRRAVESSPGEQQIKSVHRAAYDDGYERGRKHAESSGSTEFQLTKKKLTRLTEQLAAFEAASGIKIGMYNGRSIGKAVDVLVNCGPQHLPAAVSKLRESAKTAGNVADAIEVALREIGGEDG